MNAPTRWGAEIAYAGGRIDRPGIYAGVPIRTYHADLCVGPSISSGGLRDIEDPAGSLEKFYLKSYLNPEFVRPPEKDAWIFGRAAHTLLLGESGFREDFLIRPDTYPSDPSKPWNGNSLDCKRWLAEAALSGKSVLKADQVDHIRGMAEKLSRHPTIQAGILNGLVERSIVWKRNIRLDDGRVVTVWLKARPDGIPIDSNMIVDLKTCDSADPVSVRQSISTYGYEQQLALAAQGLYAVTGRKITDFVLVFIEKTAPYSINIKPLKWEAIEWGHRQNERALRKFAQAIADNHWPGYEDDEAECDLADWKVKRLMREAEQKLLAPANLFEDHGDDDSPEEAV